MTNRAAQHAKAQAEDAHVAKVECGLEESVHFGFEEEIVEGVEIDVAGSRSGGKEGSPLPPESELLFSDMNTKGRLCHL